MTWISEFKVMLPIVLANAQFVCHRVMLYVCDTTGYVFTSASERGSNICVVSAVVCYHSVGCILTETQYFRFGQHKGMCYVADEGIEGIGTDGRHEQCLLLVFVSCFLYIHRVLNICMLIHKRREDAQ